MNNNICALLAMWENRSAGETDINIDWDKGHTKWYSMIEVLMD